MSFDLRGKTVWVAGHRGMVGAALCRRLAREDCRVITVDRADLDLTDQAALRVWMSDKRPDLVLLAAARVGGILANRDHPAEFLYENLMIAANVIDSAYRAGVRKLVFLGSSCIYPRDAAQPIGEAALLTGPLEPTNEAYAVAKIAGLKLCQAYRRQYGADFIAVQPTNLYGPGDNYDLATSHVLPALLRKFHEAKVQGARSVTIWGTGTPLREFLHVDDLADALVFLAQSYSGEAPVNIGSGEEISIAGLARLIAQIVGSDAQVVLDPARPDGAPRKLLDCAKLQGLGWSGARPLSDGITQTYAAWRAASGGAQTQTLPPTRG